MKTCEHPNCNNEHSTTKPWCPECRGGVPSKEALDADICVVYFHVDNNGDVVYIGEGTPTRPYAYRGSSAERDPEHSRWFFEQLKVRSLSDIVIIKEEHLSKKDALLMENMYMEVMSRKGHSLKFNKMKGGLI